jgi:hypothetical protein
MILPDFTRGCANFFVFAPPTLYDRIFPESLQYFLKKKKQRRAPADAERAWSHIML